MKVAAIEDIPPLGVLTNHRLAQPSPVRDLDLVIRNEKAGGVHVPSRGVLTPARV